jgi:hypothetical protein
LWAKNRGEVAMSGVRWRRNKKEDEVMVNVPKEENIYGISKQPWKLQSQCPAESTHLKELPQRFTRGLASFT